MRLSRHRPGLSLVLGALAAGVLLLGPTLTGAALVNVAAIGLAKAGPVIATSAAPDALPADSLEVAAARLGVAQSLAAGHPAISRLLAQIAMQRGQFDVAAQHLGHARGDRWTAELRWRLGQFYAAQGREEEAVAEWHTSRAGRYLVMEAQRSVAAGQLEEALRWYRRSIAAEPDLQDGYLGVAGIYERSGRIDEALATYELTTTWFPASADGYLRLAGVLGGPGKRPDRGREVLLRCVDIAKDGRRCLFQLAMQDAQAGRLEEAAAQLESFLKNDPNSGDGWAQLAGVRAAAGRCDEAIHMYLNAERRGGPLWARQAPLQAGRTYRAMGRAAEAEAAFRRVVDTAVRQRVKPDEIARLQVEIDTAQWGPLPTNAPRCAGGGA